MKEDNWKYGPLTGVTSVSLDTNRLNDSARRLSQMIAESEEKYILRKIETSHLMALSKSINEELKRRLFQPTTDKSNEGE